MSHQDPPFRRDRPEDLSSSDAEEPRLKTFNMGADPDDDDEYEDETEVVDPTVSRWLTTVMNRHA